MFDFGLRIRELRESRHMSQESLGRRIGRSKPVISNYENNIKYPPLEVLISIANVFNVSLDYLVGIEKKDALYINNLNETQTNIMKLLYEEFTDCSLKGKELSSRQQKILSLLLIEFLKWKPNQHFDILIFWYIKTPFRSLPKGCNFLNWRKQL